MSVIGQMGCHRRDVASILSGLPHVVSEVLSLAPRRNDHASRHSHPESWTNNGSHNMTQFILTSVALQFCSFLSGSISGRQCVYN